MNIFPFIRFEGIQVGIARLRAPWVIRRDRLEGGGLYAIREGSCWFEMDDPPRCLRLSKGDVVGVAKHRLHALRDARSTPLPAVPTQLALEPLPARSVTSPGESGTTEILVFWSTGGHPFEDIYPALVHVPADGSKHSEYVRRALAFLEFELADGDRPGSEAIVRRLAEIVVIELLRAAMTQASDANRAWLSAAGDPSVMRAVAAMHERPGDRWSVHSLAKIAGLSRSAFVARFRRVVGDAPMQHLLRTRMQLAAGALLEGRQALPEIAESVGYDSESAFHRAFRRIYGVTPGDWRTAHRQQRRDGAFGAQTDTPI